MNDLSPGNDDAHKEIERLNREVAKQKKIISALIARVESNLDTEGSAFSLFQHMITLEEEVKNRTSELDVAMHRLQDTVSELQRAKEHAEHATTTKDKYVSLVTHDLRGPLGVMIGFLTLIKSDPETKLTASQKKIIETIIGSCQTMLELIDNVLKISRISSGGIHPNKQFLDAFVLVEKISAKLALAAQSKGVFLHNNIPPYTRVYADETLFAEALYNIASNAVKFCKDGDDVTFFISPDQPPTTISVLDTGVGIPKEIVKKMFFYGNKTSTAGTAGERGSGLGLPLSFEIMEAHGGSITAESTPGKGSVFHIYLPDVKPKVLLVSDDGETRKIFGSILSDMGVELSEAENGVQAQKAVEADKPHLIVMGFPAGSGNEDPLSGSFNRPGEGPVVPVVAIVPGHNGRDGKDYRAIARNQGAYGLVERTDGRDKFVSMMRRFIA